MTVEHNDLHKRIEAYLGALRRCLRGMNDVDVSETIQELRGHIVDKASVDETLTAAGIDSALIALGSPEELASQYMADYLLMRAEISRSPLLILGSLFRWASLSFAGFVVLLGSLVGYFLGGAFILCAVLKPFHPLAGLWAFHDAAGNVTYSVRLGFQGVPLAGRELLGWWVVPAGLVLGSALVMLTTRYALWCTRHYRKSLALPRA